MHRLKKLKNIFICRFGFKSILHQLFLVLYQINIIVYHVLAQCFNLQLI